MTQISQHFTREEFECPCCHSAPMDPVFIVTVDNVRRKADMPMHVNSGYRCPAHNKAIGGKPDSSHLRGNAGDFRAEDSITRHKIVNAAILCGVTRIGIGKTFVHLDTDKTLPQGVIWLY